MSPPHPIPIADRLATLGKALEALPDVAFAYLFGSRAAGRQGPLSDVDVAVYLDGPGRELGPRRLEVIGLVTAHLATDAVDVVVLNDAPIALAGRILRQRQVILDRRPFVRHRYESLTSRAFLDFLLFERRLLARRFPRGGQEPDPAEAR